MITNLAISGTDATSYTFTAATRPITIAPNATVTVDVTFLPATTGAKSAALTITDNATGSPQTVALTGTGVAPAISLTPSSVTFADQLQGTTSASKTVTVQNTGTSDLVISSIVLGGSNSADYAMTAPATPLTIAPNASSTITLTFTPSATGSRSGDHHADAQRHRQPERHRPHRQRHRSGDRRHTHERHLRQPAGEHHQRRHPRDDQEHRHG